MHYRDHLGNYVHHFNIPERHTQLTITTEALIQLSSREPIPYTLGVNAWSELDAVVAGDEHWDMLAPSHFAQPTQLLHEMMSSLQIERNGDPLSTLRHINEIIYDHFDYVPHSTTVDSPIDDALHIRRGVCQDFAHIMIAMARQLGIPCRYVSGYLFHRTEDHDRSEEDATHAWVEALLPRLGWVGFDPTNNLIVEDRHIRTAVGRDYADVPPTRGVFKGEAETILDVGVKVSPTEAPISADEELLPTVDWNPMPQQQHEDPMQQQQQQQQ
jgi:transglutaminase-like putative cysteine protease